MRHIQLRLVAAAALLLAVLALLQPHAGWNGVLASVEAAASASSTSSRNSGSSSPGVSPHTNNWAVIVSTSRYWFNYRHTSNALAIYRTVRAMGIPDSQILLMLPDEYACNARNSLPGSMFHRDSRSAEATDLYPPDIEVDYRGAEVNVASFLRLLTGRHLNADATARSQRLLSDADSNILIYLSGHGGNNFLKFQDNEELNSQDVRDALQQMHAQRRYRSILFMLDTCQAATLFWELNPEDTPNVVTIGSSKINQNSFSFGNDYALGVSLVDRFTFHTLDFFERKGIIAQHRNAAATGTAVAGKEVSGLKAKQTIQELFDSYHPTKLRSDVEYRADMLSPALVGARPDAKVNPLALLPLTDYFGAVAHTQPTTRAYALEPQLAAQQAVSQMQHPALQQLSDNGMNATLPLSATPLSPRPSKLVPAFRASSQFWMLLAAGVSVILLSSVVLDRHASSQRRQKVD